MFRIVSAYYWCKFFPRPGATPVPVTHHADAVWLGGHPAQFEREGHPDDTPGKGRSRGLFSWRRGVCSLEPRRAGREQACRESLAGRTLLTRLLHDSPESDSLLTPCPSCHSPGTWHSRPGNRSHCPLTGNLLPGTAPQPRASRSTERPSPPSPSAPSRTLLSAALLRVWIVPR